MTPVPRFRVWLADRGGRPVVVKAGTGHPAVAALRREAAALDALRHPGVVELVDAEWVEAGTTPTAQITTGLAGVHTFHSVPPTSAPSAVIRAGQVLATLAAFHGRGLVHGAPDPSHLVVAPTGGARWCSLGATRPATATERRREARAVVPLLLADLDAARHRGLPRRQLVRFVDEAVATVTDERLDAAAMASALARLVSVSIGAASRAAHPPSAEADRHLVGQQPPGHGEYEPVILARHEAVEDAVDLTW